MAKTVSKPASTREYHVYDDSTKMIGQFPVEDRNDGSRVVKLTLAQAQYLIDQGSVGLTPYSELSAEMKAAHSQFRGR
jgi:hypothetical protein